MINMKERRMYQVLVTVEGEDGSERELFVGPRMDRREGPEKFCEAINRAVAMGKERVWHDARVVQVN